MIIVTDHLKHSLSFIIHYSLDYIGNMYLSLINLTDCYGSKYCVKILLIFLPSASLLSVMYLLGIVSDWNC